MKRYPFFLFLFAIYPVLSLYAWNISEINIIYISRPIIVSILIMGVIFELIYLILRNSQKTAVESSIVFLALLSYGAIYNVTKNWNILGVDIGRHRFLIPFILIILTAITWLVLKRMRAPYSISFQLFNIISVVLVLLNLVQIGSKFNRIEIPKKTSIGQQAISVNQSDQKPDVYYFLLDSYPRADYLKQYMNFDNSPFIQELESRGFFVAECSLSNYSYTRLSLASTLNMNYLEKLGLNVSKTDTDETKLDTFILHSTVRDDFENAGYKIVAFETGYGFTEWRDAQYFFQPQKNPIFMPIMTAFEEMVLENSILSATLTNQSIRNFLGLSFPYYEKWSREHYIIDQIPHIPEIAGPKFVFIHLVTTHRPYIFSPTGQILMDDRFYRNQGVPVNDEFYTKGLVDGVEFTNSYLLNLIGTIRQKSKVPPVIILQGDHGVKIPGRQTIINAILLSNPKNEMYKTLSPVNNFRIIENTILGKDLDLLPDRSFVSNVNIAPYDVQPVPNPDPCTIQ